jgi:PIN domain nuclease of toxin-antitoxin system
MKALLDTHALLWFALNDSRLSDRARLMIADRDNDLFVSPATFWEIAIKVSIGKYVIDEELSAFFDQQMAVNDFTLLPITSKHAAVVATLPFHHRDPFDRMLVAQSIAEETPIVSADRMLDLYSVARVW